MLDHLPTAPAATPLPPPLSTAGLRLPTQRGAEPAAPASSTLPGSGDPGSFDGRRSRRDPTAADRKARGAFLTPEPLARHLADWAVRSGRDRVLEPSCGDGVFLRAAAARLSALRGPDASATWPPLTGVEVHPASAETARERLRAAGVAAQVIVADFFTVEPAGGFDVALGNPPYLRHHNLSGEARERARAAAQRTGVALSGQASAWAPFTVHAARFLRPGGRLGLVLPGELLTVDYAAPVRAFLLDQFARVDLAVFDQRVFPDVIQEVVVVLADGHRHGPAEHMAVHRARNLPARSCTTKPHRWRPDRPTARWTPGLLLAPALAEYTKLADGDVFMPLGDWGAIRLGAVTGDNNFFALSPARVAELGLAASDLVPVCPPGSGHLRGLAFTAAGRGELGTAGKRTWLFRPVGEPSPAGGRYIASGEAAGVANRAKCRHRRPWWQVPLSPPPDLLITYGSTDTPRLCTNGAGARHLNSVHGVYLALEHGRLGRELLPLAALNSLTLLGAELVGRARGGGLLKLEPTEAAQLPVPAPAVVAAARRALAERRPQVAGFLRERRLAAALRLVDDVLLVGELGQTATQVAELRDGHAELRARRRARGRAPEATD